MNIARDLASVTEYIRTASGLSYTETSQRLSENPRSAIPMKLGTEERERLLENLRSLGAYGRFGTQEERTAEPEPMRTAAPQISSDLGDSIIGWAAIIALVIVAVGFFECL